MNSITSFSSSSQNISYAALGVAAIALVSSVTSIALIIFTKIRLDAATKRLGKLENKVDRLTQRIATIEGGIKKHHEALTNQYNFSRALERFSQLSLNSVLPGSANNNNFYKLVDHYCNNTTQTPHPIPYMSIPPTDSRRNIDNSTYRDIMISDLQINIEKQEMDLVISHGSSISEKVEINLTFKQIQTILFEERKT